MRKYLCDIFSFLLDLFKQIIDVVAETLVYLGTAIVDVLSEILSAASSGLLSSPLGILVIGVAAWWLISMIPGEEEKNVRSQSLKGVKSNEAF